MNTETRNHIIYILVLVGLAFSTGRYTTPKKVETLERIVTVEVEKTTQDTHIAENTHKIETKKPDGTITIETIIAENTDTTTKIEKKEKEDKLDKTSVEARSSSLIVSAMVGMDITKPVALTYGAEISSNILGPIRLGAFGMTNGVVGCTVGLTF